MAIIKEGELSSLRPDLCMDCEEYEASIWLCGTGGLCERCFAIAADIPEAMCFSPEKIKQKHRDKAKKSIRAQWEEEDVED